VSNERPSLIKIQSEDQSALKHELTPASDSSCILDAQGLCVTCSDEALPVRVLHIDQETGLALVSVKDTTEEIDISLVEDVAPGDMLLAHGGVAIERL
jgi:hypothetical protein